MPSLRANRLHRPRDRGFTLAEVLAALSLMAIVIPVALEGMSIASRAVTLGQRKAAAARVAQQVLNTSIATGAVSTTGASGTVTQSGVTYRWSIVSEPWEVDSLDVVTVDVAFDVQGTSHQITLSTLHDASAVPVEPTTL
jgi:prepilin-type N-terminal cleavage/methylation domain-containing protein